MRRRLPIVVALLAGLAGAAWLLRPLLWPAPDDAGALTLYGNVDLRDVRLGFRVGGRLANVALEEGDGAVEGTLLATLDDEPYRQALAAADAAVRQAEATLKRLEAGSRPQEIEASRAAVREAEAQAVNAAEELERQRALLAQRVTTRQLLDAAIERDDQARARLAATRENLALVLEGPRQEDIDAARAALDAARANRDAAATRLEDTTLRAPSPGTVVSRVREPGAVLAPGEPVVLLTLDRDVFVRAYAAEPDLGRVAPGTAVRIRSDSREEPYHGRIGFVSPQAEFTPKTVQTTELRTDLVYRLRIVVEDPDTALRQGMPVTVTVPRGSP